MKSSQDKCLLRIKSIFGEFDLHFGKITFVCDLLLFHLPHKIVNKFHKVAKHGREILFLILHIPDHLFRELLVSFHYCQNIKDLLINEEHFEDVIFV